MLDIMNVPDLSRSQACVFLVNYAQYKEFSPQDDQTPGRLKFYEKLYALSGGELEQELPVTEEISSAVIKGINRIWPPKFRTLNEAPLEVKERIVLLVRELDVGSALDHADPSFIWRILNHAKEQPNTALLLPGNGRDVLTKVHLGMLRKHSLIEYKLVGSDEVIVRLLPSGSRYLATTPQDKWNELESQFAGNADQSLFQLIQRMFGWCA